MIPGFYSALALRQYGERANRKPGGFFRLGCNVYYDSAFCRELIEIFEQLHLIGVLIEDEILTQKRSVFSVIDRRIRIKGFVTDCFDLSFREQKL